ncbi:MAG TPA: hypothetical protein VNN18_05620 [Candidatus Xenobia bacterium]|nr:hypothetical protein [Candidatus Xenobia bacterium]
MCTAGVLARSALYLAGVVAAIVYALGPSLALARNSQQAGPRHVVLVSENEPGEHLIVRGTVYAPDGVTPAGGVQLTAHQADAQGYYCLPPSAERDQTLPRDNCPDEPPRSARIRGSLTTDAQGRYEFHTIKPGSYPHSRNPAHIHFKASGAGYPEQYPHDLNFAGDPFLSAAEVAAARPAGKFNYICEPQRERNALVCEYNIRLQSP